FGIRISKINLNLLLKNNPSLIPLTHTMEVVQGHFNDPAVSEYIRKFLGREVMIAVYKSETAESTFSGEDSADESLLPDVFFISRVPSDIKLKEFFLRWRPGTSRDSGWQAMPYRDHIVYFLAVGDTGLKIAFTRIGDVFVAGLGDRVVRRAIDVYEGARPSLAKDTRFHWPSKGFGRPDPAVSVYWDTEKIISFIAGAIRAAQTPDPRVDDALNRVKGFTTAETSVTWDELLNINSEMYFNPAELSGDTKAYVDGCHPQNNQSLFFTPKDVLVYQWVGCVDFGRYWQNVRKEAQRLAQEKQPEGSSGDAAGDFQTSLGLDIENDVIPALGGEIGWFVNTGSQFIPLIGVKAPQVAIFVKIKDQAKAEQVISVLLNKMSVQPQKEIRQGAQFNYFLTPFGGAVEPAYTILGDYFIIGLNRDILKEAVYAAEDTRAALTASPSFQKTVKSSHDRMSQVGIFYFKLGELLESYSGLIDLAYNWISTRNEEVQAQAASAGSLASGVTDEKAMALNEELAREQKISAVLEDEIWDTNLKGEDTSAREEELKRQKDKVKSLQTRIQQAKESQRSQLVPLRKLPDSDHVSIIRRNVVNPILEALKTVQALGADVSLKKDRFSTEIQVQFEK
ncbi:MAG: hypothetical protein COW13_02735, partial [Candidatus Omnitrophica bacterium CG12_big_fil_rev_8_21_14_0_65_50_5]